MITYEIFEKDIKAKKISGSYLFCGQDEELIKESILKIKNNIIDRDFEGLNYIRIDGNNFDYGQFVNSCETMPFGSEKKIVEVYRANFLKGKLDSVAEKNHKQMIEYMKDLPDYTVVIMYNVFQDKREKPTKNKNIMAFDKNCNIVFCDKLKRDKFIKKVEEIFKEKNKSIGPIEVRYFAEKLPNNFEIIKNEIEKLICYTEGRNITKKDIDLLIPRKSEDDIFDLIDLISERKIERAIDVMDEMLFKEDQHMFILISIENQFKKLYNIKLGIKNGKRLEDFMAELKVPEFVCKKLMNLSAKFTFKQLSEMMKMCVDAESRLKSSSIDKRMELEILLVNTLMAKK